MFTPELVSIVTPVYNGARFVSQTIESVLAQTYTQWEMIIIDDGSKDNTREIVEAYVQKDSRITLISQANGGSAKARNTGIARAQGQYIALLDADDLWDAEFLASQVAYMKEKNATIVCASYRRINEESEEILSPIIVPEHISLHSMQVSNKIGCLTGLYDISRFGKVYLKEELRSLRDDYAFWLDIVTLAGEAWGNPRVMASYRVMACSTTGKKGKLIKVQYRFHRQYQHFGVCKSALYVASWMVSGFLKFNGLASAIKYRLCRK